MMNKNHFIHLIRYFKSNFKLFLTFCGFILTVFLVTYSKSESNKLTSNHRMCYKSFKTKFDKKYKLMDIMDDEVLKNSNGKHIFFHLTNCINDGVPVINSRFDNLKQP